MLACSDRCITNLTIFFPFSVKITVFYIIYYTFLTGFFIAMLLIFFETLDDKVPKWQNANGIIGTNPGQCVLKIVDRVTYIPSY